MQIINNLSVSKNKSQRAFTLLEVMAAMFIFAFAMVGLGRLMVSTVETNRDARRITAATNIALDKMEEFRALSLRIPGYTALSTGIDANPLSEDGTTGGANAMFSRKWTVINNTPVTNAKTVSVSVSWELKSLNADDDRETRVVKLETIIAHPY